MSTQTSHPNPLAATPFKKRSVVSNFIFKFDETPDGKPQVALFRRSAKVSTYQHHLAPISGSIDPTDPSPIAAAWREISEETTLTPSNLSLLRQGKPYTFSDASIGREWTIYPFAFKLKTSADERQITIDWEHDSWGWHDPLSVKDIPEFGGVPRLAESLRRAWFQYDLGEQPSKILSDALQTLATDTQSGARQMAGYALKTLADIISAYELCEPSEKWWRDIRFAAWHLWKNGRESMGAAIMAALLGALAEIEPLLSQPGQSALTFHDKVLAILQNRISERQRTNDKISSALTSYITKTFPDVSPLRILTLSESSTITHALSHLAQNSSTPLDIRILESRPLFEGVPLASNLSSSLSAPDSVTTQPQHTITLYTDASAALASSKVHLVLLGADRIASSGSVSNKTGSLPAVLSAKHVTSNQAKVVILGDTEKIALPGEPSEHVIEDNDPTQVTSAWEAPDNSARVKASADTFSKLRSSSSSQSISGVKLGVSNTFFEWVPPSLIDTYITELGEANVQDIAQNSSKLAEKERQIFGSL
ncbi:hypothetical protein B0T16DRAFT_335968 [Cercophora newfieldiana]|uniref:Nudix hydrolase domain-containing protein n=1 Tax=Cercophora newfieldiana TaxID=92897 RepID=A0AA39XVJ7_9PEZI|nr:hypothetical protein B0T16DRAFT_335968 [Cercophora newfieldiana]